MCRIERWSVLELGERIESMLFERTALSKKPEALIKKALTALRETGELTPDLLMRDPYMLPFLWLADTYSESDRRLRSAGLRPDGAVLRWLDKHERQPSEEPPLGIILCAGKKRETVEILDLDARGIHVAEYLTELPPRKLLEERLHKAIESARNRIADLKNAVSLRGNRGFLPGRRRNFRLAGACRGAA